MTARGPYTASKDVWVAQLDGGTTGYGNGAGTLIHVGPVPNATAGDPDFKSRGMFEISAADVTTFMADATVINDATITVTVGENTCMGSRGATMRMLLEEMTADFAENSTSGCNLSSSSASNTKWNQSNNITTTNRAFHSSSSPSGGDDLTFDVSAIFQARLAAGNLTSAFRFRIIAANSDGTGYGETTTSRRISLKSTEHGDSSDRPRLSGNVTLGDVPKTLTAETGTGTDAISISQTSTSPTLPESGTGVDGFTGGPAAGWSTGLDENDNGRALLYLPTAGSSGYSSLNAAVDDIQLRCQFKLDKVPQGGAASFYLLARGTNHNTTYRCRVQCGGNLHDIALAIYKYVGGTATTLQYVTNIRAFLADSYYWVKFQVEGASPTTLNAKVWRAGDVEPGWVLQVEDSEASLQSAGIVGIGGALGTNVTNPPMTVEIDQFEGYAP